MKDAAPLVNWSIRLSQSEADKWDDLLYALRREIGDRTVNKTDIVRALMELASTPDVREPLAQALRQRAS